MLWFTSFRPKAPCHAWGLVFSWFRFVLTLICVLSISRFLRPSIPAAVLIIGAGAAGETLAHVYNGLRPQPFFLVGFMDDDPEKIGKNLEGFPILGGTSSSLKSSSRKG